MKRRCDTKTVVGKSHEEGIGMFPLNPKRAAAGIKNETENQNENEVQSQGQNVKHFLPINIANTKGIVRGGEWRGMYSDFSKLT